MNQSWRTLASLLCLLTVYLLLSSAAKAGVAVGHPGEPAGAGGIE